jgi:hypothetical protein
MGPAKRPFERLAHVRQEQMGRHRISPDPIYIEPAIVFT